MVEEFGVAKEGDFYRVGIKREDGSLVDRLHTHYETLEKAEVVALRMNRVFSVMSFQAERLVLPE